MDRCSFCGREKKDTNLLIAGISGHICDRCIEQAYSIVQEELGKKRVKIIGMMHFDHELINAGLTGRPLGESGVFGDVRCLVEELERIV